MKLLSKIKKFRHDVYIEFYRHMPIQNNKIILWSNSFKQYGCSPKYITEYILEHYPNKFDLVWVFEPGANIPADLHKKVRIVYYFSMEYLKELHTAKFVICNMRTGPAHYWKKRSKQIYIQTWHSSLRLKKIECDAVDTLPSSYIEAAKEDSLKIDLLLSGCKLSTQIFRRAFWYTGQILESGTPRCDLFFQSTPKIREKVFHYYNLPLDTKLALYAPTFRNNKRAETHGMDFEALKKALEEKTGAKWIIACRLHPNIREDAVTDGVTSMSRYPDMQELLAASDCLITDYSSCMFDMAIAGKPCFLYVPDLDDYIRRERGLYFNILDLPFPACRNMSELNNAICRFEEKTYKQNVDILLQTVGSYEDGQAAACVVAYIDSKSK